MAEEQIIWRGTSSQLRNLHIYLFCLFAAVAVVVLAWLLLPNASPQVRTPLGVVFAALAVAPLAYALWRCVLLRSVEYEVTTERVRVRRGIFSKRTDELELYRVKDHTLIEPFAERMFGLGSVQVTTHDSTTPVLTLAAVPDARVLSEHIRTHVERCREVKRVRLAELE